MHNLPSARVWAKFISTLFLSLLLFLAACGKGPEVATQPTTPEETGELEANATWTKIADEKTSFTVSGTKTVRYGAGSQWVQKSVTGSGYCGNWFFGSDPASGVVKRCEVWSDSGTPAAPPATPSGSTWTKIANEKTSFTVSGTKTVRYGAGSRWVQKSVTGSGYCGNDFFGSDPASGIVKSCEVQTSGSSPSPSPSPTPGGGPVSGTTVTYQADGSSFANPERGFYFAHVMSGSDPKVIDSTNIQRMKNEGITIFKRIYNLNTFKNSSISSSYLDWIQRDLDVVRSNGLKVAIRFSYNFNDGSTSDAPLSRVLGHIDQVGPILRRNADIIAFMDAGFIGKYGEWHSSTNGLTSSSSKRQILDRLLSALPSNRAVVVRYARDKKDMYGSSALSEGQAFRGSNQSRIGHKNDCFLASSDDQGTYYPLDSGSLNAQKNYLSQETLFLPQSGETCGYNAPRSDCPTALAELSKMHWSSLGRMPSDFVSRWSSQGCYNDINKRLGYRFRLLSGVLPSAASRGSTLAINLRMTNDGFAGLYNQRNMELVLRNKSNSQETRLSVNPGEDIRLFMPASGETKDMTLRVSLPGGMSSGNYDVFLNLPDPNSSLNRRASYSIRLANTNMWESWSGYNKLGGVSIR
jgi:Domain of unknown function (DUF4832)/Domain of unknown function (DUF4874)